LSLTRKKYNKEAQPPRGGQKEETHGGEGKGNSVKVECPVGGGVD